MRCRFEMIAGKWKLIWRSCQRLTTVMRSTETAPAAFIKKYYSTISKRKKQHSTALYSSILFGFMGCRIFVLCDDSLGTLTTCQPCGDVGTKHNVVNDSILYISAHKTHRNIRPATTGTKGTTHWCSLHRTGHGLPVLLRLGKRSVSHSFIMRPPVVLPCRGFFFFPYHS